MADLTADILKGQKAFAEGTKQLSDEFKSLIGEVKNVNSSLGDSFLELRKGQKDSFAGALQASKTKKLLQDFNNGILDASGELAQVIGKDLPKEFKDVGEFVKTFNASNKNLEAATQERLNKESEIATLNKQLINARAEGNQTQVKTLETQIKKDKDILKLLESNYDDIEENNKKLVGVIQESSEKVIKEASEGFDKFNSGMQELFGFGIGGFLDTLVAKTNALGNLLGMDNLGSGIIASIAEGFSNVTDKFSNNIIGGIGEGFGKKIFDKGEAMVPSVKDSFQSMMAGNNPFRKKEEPKKGNLLPDRVEKYGGERVELFKNEKTGEYEEQKSENTGMKLFTTQLSEMGEKMKGAFGSIIEFAAMPGKALIREPIDLLTGREVKNEKTGEMEKASLIGRSFDGLKDKVDDAGGVFQFMNQQAGSMFGALGAGISKLLTPITGLATALGTMLMAVVGVVAPLLLKAAIVGLVIYGFIKLLEYLDSLTNGLIGESLGGVFTSIFDFFGSITDIFTGEQTVMQAAGNMLGAAGDFVMNAAKSVGGAIMGAARALLPNWALKLLGWDEASMEEKAQAKEDKIRIEGERVSRRDDQQLENAAMESGLLKERNKYGESIVDMSMIKTAPTDQLQRLLRLDDFDDATTEALRRELEFRADVKDAMMEGDVSAEQATAQVRAEREALAEQESLAMNPQQEPVVINQQANNSNASTTVQGGEVTTRSSDPVASTGRPAFG